MSKLDFLIMAFNLFLIFLVFLVVVYLIFKIIKKVVFAILTVILLLILIMGGIVTLAYTDYNYLSSQKDFDVNIFLGDEDDLFLGVVIPIENRSMEIEGMRGIGENELSLLSPKKASRETNSFYVLVSEETFDKLIKNKTFNLGDLIDMGEVEELDLELDEGEIERVLLSEVPNEEFTKIIIEQDIFENALGDLIISQITNQIDMFFSQQNITAKEAVFLIVMAESFKSRDGLSIIVEAYKKGEIIVYPDRFTFKLLRMLPVDRILQTITPQNQSVES